MVRTVCLDADNASRADSLEKKVAGTSGLLAPRAVSSWTLPHNIYFRLQLL